MFDSSACGEELLLMLRVREYVLKGCHCRAEEGARAEALLCDVQAHRLSRLSPRSPLTAGTASPSLSPCELARQSLVQGRNE